MKQPFPTSPPPHHAAPTDPLPSSRRKTKPPLCVVTELRDLVDGTYHEVPPKAEVRIGRAPIVNDIVLPHTFVSAKHATCQPQTDHLRVSDANSTNGLFVGSVAHAEAYLYPGGTIHLSEAGIFALSAPMGKHARALDRLIGTVNTVNDALRVPRDHRCLVFTGPAGACLDQVIAAAHGAATEHRTPLVVRSFTELPTATATMHALLAEVADGWLAVDMTGAEEQDPFPLTNAFLDRLLSPTQGATLALARLADMPTPAILKDYQPKQIDVPAIYVRIRDGGLAQLVDSINTAAGLRLRFETLHADVAAALERAPWPRNFEQIHDVLVYSGRRLSGEHAGAGLLTSPSSAIRWIHKLGLDRSLWGLGS